MHRATGQFLKVRTPSDAVIVMAAWMFDPMVCAGMTLGRPQVDLLALSELAGLVTVSAIPANFPSDNGVAWEKVDEAAKRAQTDPGQADESGIRTRQAGRNERDRAGEVRIDACANPDGGRRHSQRGKRR